MTDLGELHYFLGVTASQNNSGLLLTQDKYAMELLTRAKMQHCNPCATPL
jgi:hypothetical protein